MAKQNTILHYFIFSIFYSTCVSEKVTYLSVEHPKVTYYNPEYLAYANLTAVRYGRANPIYYVGLNLQNVVTFDSNVYIDIYFYELLTNQYKRSFIEFHFTWCYLVEKDLFFGSALRSSGIKKTCPHPPGALNMANMTVNPKYIPKGFPFTRGRIVANLTYSKTKSRVGEGYIDMKLTTIEVTYLSVEHPKVTYYNPEYVTYANLTAVRYGRANPIYYVGLNIQNVVTFDSNVYVDIYFFELLTNQYKRSFIEFHFTWCYLVEKDLFFGSALRASGIKKTCPHPPGALNMANMTVNPKYIPKGFPFTRGRIVANFSYSKTKSRVGEGYIDMKLTTVEVKNTKALFEP